MRDRWSFEVWNEANLEVFWSGTPEDYLRLYDVTVAAVRVGGLPASSSAGRARPPPSGSTCSLDHVDDVGVAGRLRVHAHLRQPAAGRAADAWPATTATARAIWWTEWGPTPQHGHLVGDTVFAATFLLDGMRSSMGRIDALSHWVASDHFEELGRPPRLEHGGFGLLTVGNLRKPRWWAMELLERLGESRARRRPSHGDGAGSLVDCVAARDDAGCTGVLVWNSTLDQRGIAGNPLLADGWSWPWSACPPGATSCGTGGSTRPTPTCSPTGTRWAAVLPPTGPARRSGTSWPAPTPSTSSARPSPSRCPSGPVELAFDLPQPGISYLELTPE